MPSFPFLPGNENNIPSEILRIHNGLPDGYTHFAGARPKTASLADSVASDISLRNAPLTGVEISEIKRIAMPGARITYSGAADVIQNALKKITDAFPDATIMVNRTVTGADGTVRGGGVVQLP